MKRRTLKRMGIFIAAVMLLMTLCTAFAGAEETVTLRIGWFGSTARNEATIAALDRYTELYPNVTFEPEFTGSNPEFFDKLTTQIAANNMPDIIIMDNAWFGDMAKQGLLADLTGVDVSLIGQEYLEDGTYNGILYALPNALGSNAFVYNKKIVDTLELSVRPYNGWTWDEFYTFVEEAKTQIPENTYVASDVSTSFHFYTHYQASRGLGAAVLADETINFDKDTWMALQTRYADYRARGIIPPADIASLDKGGDIQLDVLLNGSVLIRDGFATTFSAYNSVEPGTYALVTTPRDKESTDYMKVAAFWSVNAKSEHIETAKQVVNWLVNDPEAGKVLGFVRGLQPNSEVSAAIASILNDTDKASLEVMNAIIAAGPQEFAMKHVGWNSFYELDYPTLCQQVQFGIKSPEEVYDEIIAKAKEYVH